MNPKVQTAIFLTTGAVVGAGIGYLVANQVIKAELLDDGSQDDDQNNNGGDEGDDSSTDDDSGSAAASYAPIDDPPIIVEDRKPLTGTILNPVPLKIGQRASGKPEMLDYAAISKHILTSKEPLNEVVKQRLGDEAIPSDPPAEPPDQPSLIRVISQEEWAFDQTAYLKVHMFYYDVDDVLVTVDGKFRYEQPALIFGENGRQQFGGALSGDPDVMYIRNDAAQRLFEIVRIHDSSKVEKGNTTEEPVDEGETGKKRKSNGRPKQQGRGGSRKVASLDDEEEDEE